MKKNVISKLQVPYLQSVVIHSDITVRMVQHFVSAMADNESVVFCLHCILRPGEKKIMSKRFNWDYDKFETLLCFLKSDGKYRMIKTAELVDMA